MTHSACLKIARYFGILGVLSFPSSLLAAAVAYFAYDSGLIVVAVILTVGFNDGLALLWMSAVLSELCRSEQDKPSENAAHAETYSHRSRKLFPAEQPDESDE